MPDTNTEAPRRESTWNDCDAHARYVDENGHETVVVCDIDRHSAPDDTEARHHDPHLGIFWWYDDDEVRFDDD